MKQFSWPGSTARLRDRQMSQQRRRFFALSGESRLLVSQGKSHRTIKVCVCARFCRRDRRAVSLASRAATGTSRWHAPAALSGVKIHHFEKPLRRQRLAQISGCAEFAGVLVYIFAGGQKNDRDISGNCMRLESRYELIAVEIWHLHIANDHVWSFPQDGMTTGDGIFRRENLVTGIT